MGMNARREQAGHAATAATSSAVETGAVETRAVETRAVETRAVGNSVVEDRAAENRAVETTTDRARTVRSRTVEAVAAVVIAAVLIAAAVIAGLVTDATVGIFWAVPATGAVAALAAVLRWSADRWITTAAVAAGALSLAATAVSPQRGDAATTLLVLCTMVEIVALLALIVMVVRRRPLRPASLGAAPAVAAIGTWVLRVDPPTSVIVLAGCAAWTCAGLGAVAVGGYLRALDARRRRSVADARRWQRLLLARELHDFVAHDISEILAQSQAGQILASQQPQRAGEVLRTIETAAIRALESMDRTIHVLHGASDQDDPVGAGGAGGADSGRTAPLPTLTDLDDLVARFRSSHPAEVHTDVVAGVPREVSATAYRIVIEALSNVRRHAPAAGRVGILVRRSGRHITVEVEDDGGPAPSRPSTRAGGLGLPSLADRVQALGGTVEAGPLRPSGWRIAATIPSAVTGVVSGPEGCR